MPATRSSSNQPRPLPFLASNPPEKRTSPSSADCGSPRLPLSPMRQNRSQAASRPKKAAFIPPPEEVIEISSDDEESLSLTSQATLVADFRRQINKLREESVKYKRDLDRSAKQIKELKAENQTLVAFLKPDNKKLVLDVEKLSDQLDCEICTSRMWTPYTLADCGHTFCQSCLRDWFDTIRAKFLIEHPEIDPGQIHSLTALTRLKGLITQNPQIALLRDVADTISHLVPQRPRYTCPTCRQPVQSRPTEVFALKALVGTIAAAVGESSPKKSISFHRKIAAMGTSPWDDYFPSRAV